MAVLEKFARSLPKITVLTVIGGTPSLMGVMIPLIAHLKLTRKGYPDGDNPRTESLAIDSNHASLHLTCWDDHSRPAAGLKLTNMCACTGDAGDRDALQFYLRNQNLMGVAPVQLYTCVLDRDSCHVLSYTTCDYKEYVTK